MWVLGTTLVLAAGTFTHSASFPGESGYLWTAGSCVHIWVQLTMAMLLTGRHGRQTAAVRHSLCSHHFGSGTRSRTDHPVLRHESLPSLTPALLLNSPRLQQMLKPKVETFKLQ